MVDLVTEAQDRSLLTSDVVDGHFRWGIHELVGHGRVRSETCGQFRRAEGCLGSDDKHDVVDVYGHSFKGKIAVKKVFFRCYSPQCSCCFRKGWASLESKQGEARLLEGSKHFGLVEHGMISVPLSDRDRLLRMNVNEFKAYWRKVEDLLLGRGVVGGVSMFHPARFTPVRGWYWSPHFHFLGFIVPSYGRCRRCTDKVCRGRNREFLRCDGFDAVSRREREKHGFIVKVFGRRGKAFKQYFYNGEKVRIPTERDNVRGTLSYQLSHAGLVVGSKRAVVVHWFGTCSYRKLKVTVERRKELCPICESEFVQIRALRLDVELPVGSGVHVIDGCDSNGEPLFIEAFAVWRG